MPWQECCNMDERLRFVARLLEGEKMLLPSIQPEKRRAPISVTRPTAKIHTPHRCWVHTQLPEYRNRCWMHW